MGRIYWADAVLALLVIAMVALMIAGIVIAIDSYGARAECQDHGYVKEVVGSVGKYYCIKMEAVVPLEELRLEERDGQD